MKKKSKKNEVHKSTVRLGINYYHEFVADIDLQGKPHRVFYNPVVKEFLVNEILSFNYKETGAVLLKNPVDKEVSEYLTKRLIELPKKDWLDTLANAKQRVEKILKQEKLKSQPKKQVGNKPKVNLIKATLWCIKYHEKNSTRRQTILRAYRLYGEETQVENSFVTIVRAKWRKLRMQYRAETDEFKEQNSLHSYAKSKLRIPINATKQNTTGNEKKFN